MSDKRARPDNLFIHFSNRIHRVTTSYTYDRRKQREFFFVVYIFFLFFLFQNLLELMSTGFFRFFKALVRNSENRVLKKIKIKVINKQE